MKHKLRSAQSTEGRRMAGARALWVANGMKREQFGKPIVAIVNSFTQFVPGHTHLHEIGQMVKAEIEKMGCYAAEFNTIAIDDGIAMGHDGMLYSLPSRDIIADLVEIHANATTFDGGVFLASCDKSVPALLMAIGRINIPAVFVTGGVMDAGPNLLTLEQIGKYSAMYERGEITEEQFTYYKHHACPSCGACSFMGTASTMQIMAESLGLMLPGTALMPATCEDLSVAAEEAGKTAVALAKKA